MSPGTKLLWFLALLCVVGAAVFFLLVGFTPLKQELYQRLLFSSIEGLGYKVISVQEEGDIKRINLRVPAEEKLEEINPQEILLKAHQLSQRKYANTLKGVGAGSFVFSVLLFVVSIGIEVLLARRSRNTKALDKKRLQKPPPPAVLPSTPLSAIPSSQPLPSKAPAKESELAASLVQLKGGEKSKEFQERRPLTSWRESSCTSAQNIAQEAEIQPRGPSTH